MILQVLCLETHTYIFAFLQPVSHELSLAFAAAAQVEHAHTIIFRQKREEVERFEATTSKPMQVDNAPDIHSSSIASTILWVSMSGKRASDPFSPPIGDAVQILDEELIFLEVAG